MVGGAWSEAVQIAEARERIAWHEKMSRASFEQSEALQVSMQAASRTKRWVRHAHCTHVTQL